MSKLAMKEDVLEDVSGNVVFRDYHSVNNNDEAEIIDGLQQAQKTIKPKYFYDSFGSELFEKITQLPEYYPTRTERKLLEQHATAISSHCGENCVLIEPGSGSSEKVRLLLDVLAPKAYVPMDIAAEFLRRSAQKLGREYPWLDIYALCADFARVDQAPQELPEGKRVIFYPGSTLGNMVPEDAQDFLSTLRLWLLQDDKHEGGLLIGIDLHKPAPILHAAYNDSDGVTAQFNLNALENINQLINADFEKENFDHQAFYNEQEQRIEMHLVSQRRHSVKLGDTTIDFDKHETIHTENSYKYTMESFSQLVNQAGFFVEQSWVDDEQLFSVHYLSVLR